MKNKQFKDMTKEELLATITLFGLDSDIEIATKVKNKPTNLELLDILEQYRTTQKLENGIPNTSHNTTTNSKVIPLRVMTPEENRIDLHRQVSVTIVDNDTRVQVEDDSTSRLFEFSWGNSSMGMEITKIKLDGKPQLVKRGALMRLRTIPMVKHINDGNGNVVTNASQLRFSIVDAIAVTRVQFDQHKQNSLVRTV